MAVRRMYASRKVASMEVMVHIGENLKRLRTLSALTQEELAAKAGITANSVARIERDEAEPRPTTLRKLAGALGVEPRVLIEGE
jgi:transcriptional regulator with XRE-family HTH domain